MMSPARVYRGMFALWIALCLCSSLSTAQDSEPWGLRDHYQFESNDSRLLVDPKRAEWRLEGRMGQALIPEIYTELELGDGQRIRIRKEHWITDGRDDFRDAFGSGSRFRSEFRPLEGLHMELHLNRYASHPFITMMITLRNTGKKPVTLRAIRSRISNTNTPSPLTPSSFTMSHALRRGIHTLPKAPGQSNFMEVRIPGSEEIVGLGLLQSGFMHANLKPPTNTEDGAEFIEHAFTPAIKIMPNNTAQTDALWVTLAMTDSLKLRQLFSWTESYIHKYPLPKRQPVGWITIPDETPIEALLEMAQLWKLKAITHALIPATWQRGGINEVSDATSIAEMALQLKSTGMIPGITVDPLSLAYKHKSLSIKASDGTHWLDLRLPKAREYGRKQLQRFVDWDYRFFAVAPSAIPDEVLGKMNITRSIADLVAFEMMTKAAGARPVYPTTSHTLRDNVQDWNAVHFATAAHQAYYLPTGPVRLDARELMQLSDPVLGRLSTFNGPVEIIGLPSKTLRQQLKKSFALSLAQK